MATFAFVDPTIWLHGFDFTTHLHQVGLTVDADELDNTTFGGGGYRSRIAGLKNITADTSGYWDSSPDAEAFPDLGTVDRVLTVANDDAETSVAYMAQVGKFTYQAFGNIGDVTPFSLGAMSTNGVGVVRGQTAKAVGNVSATGALGSGLNLGAVAADEFLYATFHVFSAGTTITIQVQSDADNTFATPTTQQTIGPITATGGTWMTRVAGSITDTWYRFNVSAVTGTFSVGGALGIGS